MMVTPRDRLYPDTKLVASLLDIGDCERLGEEVCGSLVSKKNLPDSAA